MKKLALGFFLLMSMHARGEAMIDQSLVKQTQQAKQMLQQKLVASAVITEISAEKVTWRNSSLGCPKESIGYLQVLTNGVRIVLKSNKQEYTFHGDSKKTIFLCEIVNNKEPYKSGWQVNQSNM